MDSSSVAPGALADLSAGSRRGMFITDRGQNVLVTFLLLLSLFALWGFCNGMIDVMDKHFQERLHLSLAQSAQVQRAHYLGYLLMAIPAGWLATKLGYKSSIVGLLMVSVGGFWFYPATQIDKFWAFLVGVCFIAAGLTCLEIIANPYATVLGPQQYSATRINLAQSTNGFALLFGPIVGGMFFYNKDASGASAGGETLWIPSVFIAVLVLAAAFVFAPMPDIKTEDDYYLDDAAPGTGRPTRAFWRQPHFLMAVAAQFLYVAALAGVWSYFINYMTTQTSAVSQIMGAVGDAHGMSKVFVVPLLCFAFVGAYGYLWPRLSGHEAMVGVNTSKGN